MNSQKNTQENMTGAQIVVEALIDEGVSDVFGYPGGQVLDIYDELYRARGRIRHILTAHEQGAAHAADGYSRVTGRVGVVIATSGPGATNLVTGIATAMLDSIPMIAITGNVPTSMIGKDSFQEINITGITLPITKHNYFVTDVNELADTIREAFQIAKSGRPGPVLIDIPKDVQLARASFTPRGVVPKLRQREASDADIDRAVALINASKRPYIYIGGGAAGQGMTDSIIELAQRLDAYIGCTFMGLSAIPSSNERFLGMQGMHGRYASSMANRMADLILGVGIRFSDRATGNFGGYAHGAKIIQLDVDLSEINKNIRVDVGLNGSLVSSFERLLSRCEAGKRPAWRDTVKELRAQERRLEAEAAAAAGERMTPAQLLAVVNRLKTADTIIATDVGQHQMWTAQYASFERPRRFASSGGLGTMGYGMGAAIGAAIGEGERVILITGDGSFGMNLNELATAVTYSLPITIIIMNNGVLGMVRQWQSLFYEGHYSATVLDRRTDFVKLAEAFGAEGCRVSRLDELEAALRRALSLKGPFVIDAAIDPNELVLPMLPPGGTAKDIITEKGKA